MTLQVSKLIEHYGKKVIKSEVPNTSLEHLSDVPWSNYTAADYTVEQWHAACLIHLHDGPPTSKSECKLPVKTPSGVVNKNGVHAAAAALAGARGGVHASEVQKASAAKALRGYYTQMNEDPPPSLKQSNIEVFIEHHGVKGMKWGIRHPKNRVKVSSDFKRTAPFRGKKPHQLTNKQLRAVNERINLEQSYRRMNPSKVQQGASVAKGILAVGTTAASAYALMNSPAGKAFRNVGKKAVNKQLKLPL
jgi:hypothetical protein